MQIKGTMRCYLAPVRMAVIAINEQTASVGEKVEKREASWTLGGMQIDATTVESRKELPQKFTNGSALWSRIPLLGISPKKTATLIWKNICTLIFIAALFIRFGISPSVQQ